MICNLPKACKRRYALLLGNFKTLCQSNFWRMIDVFHLAKIKAFVFSPPAESVGESCGNYQCPMQQTQASIGQERTRASTRLIRLFRVSVSQCLFTLATRLLVAYLPCMRYFSDGFWFIWFSLPQRSSRKGEKKVSKTIFVLLPF